MFIFWYHSERSEESNSIVKMDYCLRQAVEMAFGQFVIPAKAGIQKSNRQFEFFPLGKSI